LGRALCSTFFPQPKQINDLFLYLPMPQYSVLK